MNIGEYLARQKDEYCRSTVLPGCRHREEIGLKTAGDRFCRDPLQIVEVTCRCAHQSAPPSGVRSVVHACAQTSPNERTQWRLPPRRWGDSGCHFKLWMTACCVSPIFFSMLLIVLMTSECRSIIFWRQRNV